FQAEDGIRDFHVTGVQTCALPILLLLAAWAALPLFPGTSAASASGPLVPDPIPKPPATHPRLFVSSPADIEELRARTATGLLAQIGRASCRERVESAAYARPVANR